MALNHLFKLHVKKATEYISVAFNFGIGLFILICGRLRMRRLQSRHLQRLQL